jgi:regulatory protein
VTPRKAAMDLLARREHSRRELYTKLRRRFSEEAVSDAIERLSEEGLQSDQRFAESFSRERLYRAYGPRRIRAELQQRGVEEALIEAALAAVVREEDVSWSAKAREALERRFGTAPAADIRERARRARYLNQRGFDSTIDD